MTITTYITYCPADFDKVCCESPGHETGSYVDADNTLVFVVLVINYQEQ